MVTDAREMKIYEAALSIYGFKAQEDKFLEEMVEVMGAYMEFKKDRDNTDKEGHFIRELVDANLMIMQMAAYYDWDYFWKYRETVLNELPQKFRNSAGKNTNVRFILQRFFPEFLEEEPVELAKEQSSSWKPDEDKKYQAL